MQSNGSRRRTSPLELRRTFVRIYKRSSYLLIKDSMASGRRLRTDPGDTYMVDTSKCIGHGREIVQMQSRVFSLYLPVSDFSALERNCAFYFPLKIYLRRLKRNCKSFSSAAVGPVVAFGSKKKKIFDSSTFVEAHPFSRHAALHLICFSICPDICLTFLFRRNKQTEGLYADLSR